MRSGKLTQVPVHVPVNIRGATLSARPYPDLAFLTCSSHLARGTWSQSGRA
ncbi:chaplin family protein [Streptomyces fulvorobeus]|uniref:chaplin family protein n=1 Tax=Streptomyces fulvorobeus TaxID=284028 RepID=UPI003530FE27